MHMFFWWDYKFNNFLFYGFNISSIICLILLVIGLMGFSLLFEYVKMLHAKVKQKRFMMIQKQLRSICPSDSDVLLTSNSEPGTSTATEVRPTFVITRKDRIIHFLNDMSLWLSQNILGYMLMLSVMFYNVYLLLGVFLGATLGYFLFGPTLLRITIENCRAKRTTFCMADCGSPGVKRITLNAGSF